ncbi:restriction endonuclease subunit S [Vibrio cholerae]
MELMPGYKRSDVGVIPDDWDAKPLGEIGDSLIGLTYRPSEVRKYGTLVLRSSNVQNGTLCFDDNVFVDTDIPDRIMVRSGDILVCVRNGSRDLIGKSAFIDERALGMTFGAFMGVFRSEYGGFLRHVFQSGIFKKQINEHLGATINQITNKSLNSFKVPLPPTNEERTRIASALSDVDALLSTLDQMIAKKRDLKQAAMQQLLTGKTRLPGFSGEWDERQLSEIGESLIGLTYSPSQVRQYGTLVLRSSNVQNGTLCFDDNVFVEADIPERIMVSPGDILMCVRNGSRDLIGKSALIDERAIGMTFGAFMAVFRSEHGNFLLHAFQSETFKKQINEHLGATINQITNKSLNSFKVPFPPTNEERTKIAAVLSDMDSELAALESRRDKTRNIKQAMMQELLTGKTRLV